MAPWKDQDTTVQINETELQQNSQSPSTIPVLARWPINPKPLRSNRWTEKGLDAYDIILCLTPIALIIEAILCVVAAHQDRYNTGFWVDSIGNLTRELIRVNDQLTTAFTVVFVLIFTTFLKRYALWRAQTGESVARLEQYQASTSLPSTLKAVWSLRSFNFLSCILVFAWSFYYVGSQASRNEYKYEATTPYGRRGKFDIAYQSSIAKSIFEPTLFPETSAYNLDAMNRDFTRWCLADLGKGYDLHGNLRVPWIYYNSSAGWQDTRSNQELEYASYAGIRLEAEPLWLPSGRFDADSNIVFGYFTFNTSYIELNCDAPSVANISEFPANVPESTSLTINMTSDEYSNTLTMWERYNKTAVKGSCEVWTTQVEISGHCDGTNCQVSSAQVLPDSQEIFDNPDLISIFLDQLVSSQADWLKIYNNWPKVEAYAKYGGSLFSHVPKLVEFGISDWSYQFTNALMKTLNTYWYASRNIRSPLAFYPHSISDDDMYKVIIGEKKSDFFDRSVFHGSVFEPAYRLNVAWVVADLMSNTLLLAAAILSFWLRKQTLAPDIFGYVSSLTRDNPNIPLPDGGTTLSGLDRARLLKDLRVRIVDMSSSDGVGRVTMVHADAAPVEVRDLEKGKNYV